MTPTPSTDNYLANASSQRRVYFRALMRRKPTVYSLVLGCVGAFVYGAYLRSPLVMALLPLAVAALVLVIVAAVAEKRSERSFFFSFAEAAGLEYVGRWELPPFTPLLGAGDHQYFENWMIGDVLKEPRMSGGLGHFVYEHMKETPGNGGRVYRQRKGDQKRVTVCLSDLEESIHLFKGIFLRRRRGLMDFQRDWLAGTRSRAVEVESSTFTNKYELRITEDQDEIVLRQLLSPTLVNWLAEHPLSPGFELRAGTLVVFVPRVLEDGGTLTFLLDATREIAQRVLRELRDDAGREAPKTKIAGL